MPKPTGNDGVSKPSEMIDDHVAVDIDSRTVGKDDITIGVDLDLGKINC